VTLTYFSDGGEKYLLWVEQNSLCADANKAGWRQARLENFTELYGALLGVNLELQPSLPVE
jgi:hypothetical protein